MSNCLHPQHCSPPGSFVHGIFSGKNIGVGCHFLLQELFLTQGSNQHLLHWQADSLPLSHKGSPCILNIHLAPIFYSFKKILDLVCVYFLIPPHSPCFLGNFSSEEGKGSRRLRSEPLKAPTLLLWAEHSLFSTTPLPLNLPSVSRILSWDFPGGPVVGTLHSKWAGHRFNSWLRK